MRLWEPKECCCCFNLRTGSLILSSLMLVGSVINLYIILNSLVDNNKLDDKIQEFCFRQDPQDGDCETQMKKIAVGVATTQVVLSVIKIICSSLMILGIKKNITSLMIPLMVLVLIQLMLTLVCGVIFIVLQATIVGGGLAFALALFIGVLIFFETYFLLVLRAYYLQVNRAAGQMHDVLQDEAANVEGVPENKLLLKLKN